MPIIQKRIRNYLQADVFKEEFSHTLLHNQNVFDEFKKISAYVNNPASAQEEAKEVAQTEQQASSLFYPPASFITEGGLEDFYEHEMRKIVNGVELDDSMEIVQEELTPDGNDFY